MVYKDPITDPGKKSKRGYMSVHRDENNGGNFFTKYNGDHDFENDEIKQPFNYHNLYIKNHSEIWGKQQRIFSKEEVKKLLSFSLFNHLKNKFGYLRVVDIEGIGYPEIYWRIVRPNKTEDVSGIHADSWFFTHTNKMTNEEQKNLLKRVRL